MSVDKHRILLLEGIHPGAKERLESLGHVVETEKSALQGDALVRRAQGFQGLGIRSKTKITAEVLRELPELQAIGAFCIGTDQVDLAMANRNGIAVFNAPYSNTRSVAELIISEVVALSRQWAYRSQQVHQGIWQKSAVGCNEVRGKTLGIIGYGHIGSQVSVLAEAIGLQVLFFDVVKKLPLGNAKASDSLSELLRQSDFVSLHVPETPHTRNMIGASEIALMKPGSYLLNASRGTVVDLQALKSAIESKHLAGAAVDVFPIEPDGNSEDFHNVLIGLPNVILTPHIGGSTEEAQVNIGLEVAESLHRFLSQGSSLGAVNFPTVDTEPLHDCPRIINIHENVPGVLSSINSIISEYKGNIISQRLSTDDQIGYLVLDVEFANDIDLAIQKITGLKPSIKTRRIN